MLDSIRSRGPDDTGYVSGDWFSVGVCRLSIVAVDSGQQPVSTAGGNIYLAFNGELYNFESIRHRLQREYGIRTDSEAEALIHAYATRGPSFVQELDGDFAILVLDRRSRTCYAFRDALGVKPLYYTSIDDGQTWLFASHIKALFRHTSVSTDLDYLALAENQVLRFWSMERTCFKSIRQLRPGHGMRVRSPAHPHPDIPPETWCFAALPPITQSIREDPSGDTVAECAVQLRRSVTSRVRHSEIAPIVLALSGGVDSIFWQLVEMTACHRWCRSRCPTNRSARTPDTLRMLRGTSDWHTATI